MQDIARVDDIQMAYCRFGQGNRTMVILPGLSIKSVVAQEEALAERFMRFTEEFTVYVFDRRLNLPETYPVDEMAEDTARVMGALGLRDCCIFGASQGGMMTMLIAINHPELAARIVLGSTTSCGADSAAPVVESWEKLARQGRIEELADVAIDNMYSPATIARYGESIRSHLLSASKEDLRRFIILASGIPSYSCFDRLGEIKAKALVIGCFGDRVVGWRASVDIAERLGCPLFLYGTDFGHCVFDEAMDYRGHLFDFFVEG